MKPSLLFITGWAFGPGSMQPLADRLSAVFDVQVLSGAQALQTGHLPAADFIIGWSMGGMLAIEHLPASCKKLVLIASTARFCATDSYPCGIPEKVLRRMIVQLKRDPTQVLAEFYKNAYAPRLAPTDLPNTEDALAEGLTYLLNTDLRHKIPSLKLPVLLLHGTQDRIIPPEASAQLAKSLPQSRLSRLENCGHKPDDAVLYSLIFPFLTGTN